MKSELVSKIDKHWSSFSPDEALNIFNFLPIKKYFFSLISGKNIDLWDSTNNADINLWTIEEILKEHLPFSKMLSIGCGQGFLERLCFFNGVFKECVGFDISQGSIKIAKELAEKNDIKNIQYIVSDAEDFDWENQKFDLIWANGSLHHIKNIETIIEKIFGSLNIGGFFICNEYVGPNQQQLSNRHLEIINSVIHLIPEELKHRTEDSFTPSFFRRPKFRRVIWEILGILTFRNSILSLDDFQINYNLSNTSKKLYHIYRKIKEKQIRQRKKFRFGKVYDNDPYYFRLVDPSECINSSKIISSIKKFFKNVDIRYYNGSLLKDCIDPKFIRNFDINNINHRKILNFLIETEKFLIDVGEIEPHFAHIICQK